MTIGPQTKPKIIGPCTTKPWTVLDNKTYDDNSALDNKTYDNYDNKYELCSGKPKLIQTFNIDTL